MTANNGHNKKSSAKATLVILGVILVACALIVYFGRTIVPQVATLYLEGLPSQPYFQPASAWLLYILMPSVVLASLILWMLPGIYLAMTKRENFGWTDLIPRAFGVSFILYFLAGSAVKIIVGPTISPQQQIFTVIGLGFIAWVILAARLFRNGDHIGVQFQKSDWRRIAWTIAIPLVVLTVLLPIFFWQDIHDDACEALEIGRSLSTHLLPRFPTPTGLLGLSAGMTPMAYPVNWFVQLFGPLEVAARLPFLLYLPVLFNLLVQLSEWQAPRKMRFAEEAIMLLTLMVYTVAMVFNSSYDPYFADIAAPTALETFTVVGILATIYFLWSEQYFWFFFFALLTYFARPSGLIVLAMLGLAIFLFLPSRRRAWLPRIALAIGLCMVIVFIYDKLYIPSLIGDESVGYTFRSTLTRFRYLTFDDLNRVGFVLFPSGILPFLALFAYRWQDSFGHVITFLSLSYFAIFYIQGFVALHYFVPVMVLPTVVFWRIYLDRFPKFHRLVLPLFGLTVVLALLLSLPQHFEINRKVRSIGQRTALAVGNYEWDYLEQVRHFELLFEFLPPDWRVTDPSEELVSGYCSIIYYSTRSKPSNTPIHYVIQPLDESVPPDFKKVTEDKTVALYIGDEQQWRQDRFSQFNTNYRSPLYDIPRTTLFRHWGEPAGEYSIDLRKFVDDRLLEIILPN